MGSPAETEAAVEAVGSSSGTQHSSLCEEHLCCSHPTCLPHGLCCPVPNNANLGVKWSREGSQLAAHLLPIPPHPWYSVRSTESTRDPSDAPCHSEGQTQLCSKAANAQSPLQMTKWGSAHLHPVPPSPVPLAPAAKLGPLCMTGIQAVAPAGFFCGCSSGLLLFLACIGNVAE